MTKCPYEPLEVASRLGDVLNNAHGTDLSRKFWRRYLLQYAYMAVEQFEYLSLSEAPLKIAYQPIRGLKPASGVDVIQSKVENLLREVRTRTRVGTHSRVVVGPMDRICLGVRAKEIADACGAVPLPLTFVSGYFKKQSRTREMIKKLAEGEENIFFRNAIRYIPRMYVESHMARLGYAQQLINKLRPREIFFEHFSNHFQALVAYLASENGALLTQMQPGGHVGETKSSLSPPKRSEYDRLYTYGWKMGEQDVPFYAMRLEQFGMEYRRYKAPTTGKDIDILIVFNSLRGESAQEAFRGINRILAEELNQKKYGNILLRPRGRTKLLSSRSEIARLGPDARFQVDSGKAKMAELCASARMVIQPSHPSTNFLECIFVDQPVMAVIGGLPLTDLAAHYKEKFRKVGVLHNSFQDLLACINSIHIEPWWQGVVATPWYKEFKLNFARSRYDYLRSLPRFDDNSL